MRVHKGVAVFAASGMAFSLAACSPSTEAGSSDKVTVEWETWASSNDEIDRLDQIREIVQEQNPDINVELSTSPWDAYFTKLTTNLSTGDLPCVLGMNGQRLLGYQPALSPLTQEDLATAGIDASADIGDEAMSVLQLGGEQLGVTADIATMVVYYNADLFEAAGVPLPTDGWTFDDFEQAAKSITEKTDAYGFGISPTELQWATLPMSKSGVQFVNDDNELDLTNPAFVDAATWYSELVTKDKVAAAVPSASDADWGTQVFLSGDAAMAVDGTWRTASALSEDLPFTPGVVSVPVEGDPFGLVLGSGFGIGEGCENREEALKVLGSLVSKEVQDLRAGWGDFPSRIESRETYFGTLPDGAVDSVKASVEGTVGLNLTDKYTQVATSLTPELVAVYNSQESTEAMLDKLQLQFGN